MDYFEARYYSSSQGRFSSPDEPFMDQSEDDPQSWNLYTYVRNNPLTYIDPTGNSAQETKNKDDDEDEFINTEDNPEIIKINSKRDDDDPDPIVMHRLLPDFPTIPYRERMMREWWKYTTPIPREMQYIPFTSGNPVGNLIDTYNDPAIQTMMVFVPIPGGPLGKIFSKLRFFVRPGRSKGVVEIVGGNPANNAARLFNELRGANPVRPVPGKPGVFTAKSATGHGTVTLRTPAGSGSGHYTVDTPRYSRPGEGIREIKFK